MHDFRINVELRMRGNKKKKGINYIPWCNCGHRCAYRKKR